MMADSKFYIEILKKNIEKHKNKFKAVRYLKESDGFGGSIINEQEVEFEGVIYNRKTSSIVFKIEGKVASGNEKLLALPDSDIKKGDVFYYQDRKLRIKFINNYLNICLQCELEVVEYEN